MNASTSAARPLVSIGVPIRNGGAFTRGALETLVGQSYAELEIIVSDNASTDETSDIIDGFARRDARIRVFRHQRVLSAAENFRFVFEQARGDYFMWAACDDRRSANYVEQLASAMLRQPESSLAFGEVAEISDVRDWQDTPSFHYPFETHASDTTPQRLRRYTRMNCLHVYGLLRRELLTGYFWPDLDNGPDIPLLLHLALAGEFVRAEAAQFYYYVPPVPKTLEARALHNSSRRLKPFPEIRLAWACAQAAKRSGEQYGRRISILAAFAIVYSNRHWRWIKPRLFAMSPAFVVSAYRALRKQKAS